MIYLPRLMLITARMHVFPFNEIKLDFFNEFLEISQRYDLIVIEKSLRYRIMRAVDTDVNISSCKW